jgi:hypothetical protein
VYFKRKTRKSAGGNWLGQTWELEIKQGGVAKLLQKLLDFSENTYLRYFFIREKFPI